MSIVSRDRLDILDCVEGESLERSGDLADVFDTARAYHDLRDAAREVQRQYREVLGPNEAGEVLAYVIGDLDAMLARVERGDSG